MEDPKPTNKDFQVPKPPRPLIACPLIACPRRFVPVSKEFWMILRKHRLKYEITPKSKRQEIYQAIIAQWQDKGGRFYKHGRTGFLQVTSETEKLDMVRNYFVRYKYMQHSKEDAEQTSKLLDRTVLNVSINGSRVLSIRKFLSPIHLKSLAPTPKDSLTPSSSKEVFPTLLAVAKGAQTPKARNPGRELNDVQQARISFLSPDLQNASANCYFQWYDNRDNLQEKLEFLERKLWEYNPPTLAKLKEVLDVHDVFVRVKEMHTQALRDIWPSQLPEEGSKWRGYIATVLMILTPLASDSQIFELIRKARFELGVEDPKSLFNLPVVKQGQTFMEVVRAVGMLFPTNLQYRKASYVVMMTLVVIVEGGMPDRPDDLYAFGGVGLKILYEIMAEGIGKVCGIGCDGHMCKQFLALGWVSPKVALGNGKYDHELACVDIARSFPKHLWKAVNPTYAGIGQLLQNKETKETVAANLLQEAAIMSPLLLKQIEKVLIAYGEL